MKVNQDDLHRWLDYDPETGRFFWKEKPPKARMNIGDEAGSYNRQHGHRRRILWVDGKRIYAARAAYIYVHGDIPVNALVDHIDGDRLNDRIANLRLASSVQNAWNRLQRASSVRMLGVSKDANGRFKARIQPPGSAKVNLGTWATEAEAHAAYMGAAAILHSEFWIGNRVDAITAKGAKPRAETNVHQLRKAR